MKRSEKAINEMRNSRKSKSWEYENQSFLHANKKRFRMVSLIIVGPFVEMVRSRFQLCFFYFFPWFYVIKHVFYNFMLSLHVCQYRRSPFSWEIQPYLTYSNPAFIKSVPTFQSPLYSNPFPT